MIVKGLLELIFGLLKVVFAPVSLAPLPTGVQTVVDKLTTILVDSVGLLGIFIDFKVVGWLVPVVIVIVSFDKVWKLIMFILRKIPFVGIE